MCLRQGNRAKTKCPECVKTISKISDLSEENSVEINRVGTGHSPGEETSFLCWGDEGGGGTAVQLYEGSVMRGREREGYYLI